LTCGGWEIEAADAATASVWDHRVGAWRPAAIRFGHSEVREVAGVKLPIMPRDQLLDYKIGLGREVDSLDIQALRGTAT